jgi:PhnB protein
MPTHVPDGFHTATPYLIVRDPAAAIAFYTHALDAREIMRNVDAAGRVTHAEVLVGDSPVMLAGEFTVGPLVAQHPARLGGASMHLYLYVEDVDALFARSLAAGAREVMPLADQSYGDRSGGVMDPDGHVWWLATFQPDRAQAGMADRVARATTRGKP